MRLETARTLEQLEALAGAWQDLEGITPLATLGHAWVVAAVESYGERRSPQVLLAYRGDELVGLAPLWRSRRLVRRLVLIGSEELAEPMDVVAADEGVRDFLVQAMLDTRMPVALMRLHAGARTAGAVREAAEGRTRVLGGAAHGHPWVALGPHWAQPRSQLSARRRSDLRRAERRAANLGKPLFEVLQPGLAEVDAIVEEAVQVEARGWKGRAGTALLHDAPRGAFYRAFARRTAAEGRLRVSFLRIDGRPAAMQIGSEFAGRYWTFKIGYDEDFRRVSPGVLLMDHTIGWAARRGLAGFEMLGAAEDWLRLWTTGERRSETLRCYPGTARGAYALAGDAVHLAGRRLARSWRAGRRAAKARAGPTAMAGPVLLETAGRAA